MSVHSKFWYKKAIPVNILILIGFIGGYCLVHGADSEETLKKRRLYLFQLQQMMPEDPTDRGAVTPLDTSWQAWLTRTAELPPDFDALPSLPLLASSC